MSRFAMQKLVSDKREQLFVARAHLPAILASELVNTWLRA
jgi:hypothetical protein